MKKIKVKTVLTIGYNHYLIPSHIDISDLVYGLAQAIPCTYTGEIQEGEVEVSAKNIITTEECEDIEEEN